MDNNNQNSNPSQPDLSSQYDEILEKYSQQLATDTVKPNTEELPAEAPAPITESQPQPELMPEPELAPEPAQLPPPPVSIDSSVPSFEPTVLPPSDDQTYQPIKKPSNFFKILFFISLLIFLGVAGVIVYTIFFAPVPRVDLTIDSATPTVAVEPSPSGPVCELNDKKYTVGETFTATDGCNTCTCDENLMISCTEKACPTLSPSTSSATKDWKKFSSTKSSISFNYPPTMKISENDYNQEYHNIFLSQENSPQEISVNIKSAKTGKSPEGKICFPPLSSDCYSISESKSITVNGVKGYRFDPPVFDPLGESKEQKQRVYIFEKNNLIYSIYQQRPSINEEKYLSVIDGVVSSIEFQ